MKYPYVNYQGKQYVTTNTFYAHDKNGAIRIFRIMKKRGDEVILLFDGDYWKIMTWTKVL